VTAGRSGPRRGRGKAEAGRSWTGLLIRNTVLWLAPVTLVWLLLTPLYNRFLLESAQRLLNLTESPAVTDLAPAAGDGHDAVIARRDFTPVRRRVHSFRVTDLHVHFLLLGALFLGVPRIGWRQRLANLALACVASVCFDVVLLFFYVKFIYATQLGAWSLAHYGPFARNFYGLGKHLLDLPFKLALPLVLWSAFYLPRLLQESGRAASGGEGS
jgi:hypothetical protein